ncbi:hypothetical protein [Streptomyces sporangiiformans]|uniref:Uncharacterized protein n=1 Tax=Streptomyces sporangiiformans TaxID=2315329 RepID=A0A505DMA8_9ACTN|nr:hypothetical protein [Streptomyces sporangiiformans]TPQ22026.1 hypothetical protein FGD71_011525 [Streptomyces sporangiiformans]
MIRTVGFFPEQPAQWGGIKHDESIHRLVRKSGESDENEIVAYLLNGVDIFSEMGAEVDVL